MELQTMEIKDKNYELKLKLLIIEFYSRKSISHRLSISDRADKLYVTYFQVTLNLKWDGGVEKRF